MLDVDDMSRAVSFYREAVGLSVGTSTPAWTELRFRDATLALHSGRGTAELVRTGLSFEVEDLDGFASAVLEHGGALLNGPFSPRPGLRLAEFTDPDNNYFMGSEADAPSRG